MTNGPTGAPGRGATLLWMFNRDRPDHPDRPARLERGTTNRVTFSARLVMYGLLWDSAVLDCVAGEDHRLILGDHELAPGEPFSLEVRLPADGWLGGALATLDRWSEDGRPRVGGLAAHPGGARVRTTDGSTIATFDLLTVMGRRPRL